MRQLRPALPALFVIICLTACGPINLPAPGKTVAGSDQAPTATATKATKAKKPSPTTEAKASKKKLPNVVGMNLQAGQDRLQAAGFYILNDKDATGQNRFQVYDRNWVVTRQSPAGGSRVSTSTLITLYAKKYGE
ncbi:PASTA domain-containing protein [Nonomuraea sp. NPDC052129]|uniref:PASTA domain-containing protein n=1 Tax=unclassified Nonomuraea TaxID=2593643 RepID=UPI0033FE5BF7